MISLLCFPGCIKIPGMGDSITASGPAPGVGWLGKGSQKAAELSASERSRVAEKRMLEDGVNKK